MDVNQQKEHLDRLGQGEKARAFLQSDEWLKLVKPIINSLVTGVADIRNMKSAELTSEVKAQIEVKSRKLTVESLESIEHLINAFVIDGDESRKLLERDKEVSELYKSD